MSDQRDDTNSVRIPLDVRRASRGTWLLALTAAAVSSLLLMLSFRPVGSQHRASSRTPEPVASAPWRAAIYDAPRFMGPPRMEWHEQPSHDWVADGPAAIASVDWFTIRWDTCLQLDRPSQVSFTLSADDRARLFFNDELVSTTVRVHQQEVSLVNASAGRHYLVLEFEEHAGNALLHFDVDTGTTTHALRPPGAGRFGLVKGPCE